MTLQDSTIYNEIARRLRIELAAWPSHVMHVNGGRSGRWLEVQRGDWYFEASDRDGAWGVTVYEKTSRGPLDFPYELEGMHLDVYWRHSREDGPDGDKATAEDIIDFFKRVGMLSGIPALRRAYLMIQACDGRFHGTHRDMETVVNSAKVPYTLMAQRVLRDGKSIAWVIEVDADQVPVLIKQLYMIAGLESRVGQLDFMETDRPWPWTDEDPPAYIATQAVPSDSSSPLT